jgi:hypothetical protein
MSNESEITTKIPLLNLASGNFDYFWHVDFSIKIAFNIKLSYVLLKRKMKKKLDERKRELLVFTQSRVEMISRFSSNKSFAEVHQIEIRR